MLRIERAIKFLFFLFVFLLPWQTQLILRDTTLNGYAWEYGKVSILVSEIILWALLVLYVIWLLRQPRPQLNVSVIKKQFRHSGVLAYWFAALFVLWCGVTIAWSPLPTLAIARWLTLVEAVTLFSFFIIFKPAVPLTLHDIALTWIGGAVVQSVLGVYQFLSQYVFANSWLGMARHEPWVSGAIILQTATERWLRSYGSLPHPNVLGGYVVIAILWCCYLVPHVRTRLHRMTLSAVLALLAVTLLFSFSRSAWIALGVSSIIFIWYGVHHRGVMRHVGVVVLPALVAVMIIGWSLSGPIATRLAGHEPLEISSIQLRLTYTDQALALIGQHWFTGVGIGQYTLAVYQNINHTWPGYVYQPVHNVFLLLFSEVGGVGVSIFCLMLIAIFYGLRTAPNDLGKVVIMASGASIFIIGLFDHYWWTHYTGMMMLWFVAGLAVRFSSHDKIIESEIMGPS